MSHDTDELNPIVGAVISGVVTVALTFVVIKMWERHIDRRIALAIEDK